jgi:hypothetical protein
VLRAQRRIRERHPEAVTRVVQRTKTLKHGLARATWLKADVPTYLIASATPQGIEFWSAAAHPIATISSGSILAVEVGRAVTSRTVPSVVVKVRALDGQTVTVDFVPSRAGWELFPMLDPGATLAFARQLSDMLRSR